MSRVPLPRIIARRTGALAAATALLVALGSSSATAAENDAAISVEFSTNYDAAVTYTTTDSFTMPQSYDRVNKGRTDIRLKYTILKARSNYPMPRVELTGGLDMAATQRPGQKMTYKFRFGCDSTVPNNACARWTPRLFMMNLGAAQYDNSSAANFETQIGGLINQFGTLVPVGITGTVTVSLVSDIPLNGSLKFKLERGDGQSVPAPAGAEQYTPEIITPLIVSEPVITAGSAAVCANFEPFINDDGATVTPTGARDITLPTVTDNNRYEDRSAVTLAGTTEHKVGETAHATFEDAAESLRQSPAGTYEIRSTYTSAAESAVANEIPAYSADRTNDPDSTATPLRGQHRNRAPLHRPGVLHRHGPG